MVWTQSAFIVRMIHARYILFGGNCADLITLDNTASNIYFVNNKYY